MKNLAFGGEGDNSADSDNDVKVDEKPSLNSTMTAPMRPYLARAQGNNSSTNFLMGGNSTVGSKDNDNLPLASSEYHQLCEMLIFYIELPSRGMQSAHKKL